MKGSSGLSKKAASNQVRLQSMQKKKAIKELSNKRLQDVLKNLVNGVLVVCVLGQLVFVLQCDFAYVFRLAQITRSHN